MKYRKFLLVVLITVGIFSAGCEQDSANQGLKFPLENPDHIDSQDYDLYSFILDETFSSEKIVISQETFDYIRVTRDSEHFDYFREKFPNFDTTLVDNLNEVNDTTYLFEDQFHSDNNQLIVVSPKELAQIFDSRNVNDNWQEFYSMYENAAGYIKFSRIGYNDDKTQALVEAGHFFASLGGQGSIIYLVKQQGSWVIQDRLRTWVA